MNNKGQMFSMDMLIAVIVFILILGIMFFGIQYSIEKINMEEQRYDLEMVARESFSVLLETPGNPNIWELSNVNSTAVSSLGLAIQPWYLSTNKISSIETTNLSEIKEITGFKGPGYNMYLGIYEYTGTMPSSPTYSFGDASNSSAKEVVVLNQIVLLDNGNYARVKMEAWI